MGIIKNFKNILFGETINLPRKKVGSTWYASTDLSPQFIQFEDRSSGRACFACLMDVDFVTRTYNSYISYNAGDYLIFDGDVYRGCNSVAFHKAYQEVDTQKITRMQQDLDEKDLALESLRQDVRMLQHNLKRYESFFNKETDKNGNS